MRGKKRSNSNCDVFVAISNYMFSIKYHSLTMDSFENIHQSKRIQFPLYMCKIKAQICYNCNVNWVDKSVLWTTLGMCSLSMLFIIQLPHLLSGIHLRIDDTEHIHIIRWNSALFLLRRHILLTKQQMVFVQNLVNSFVAYSVLELINLWKK